MVTRRALWAWVTAAAVMAFVATSVSAFPGWVRAWRISHANTALTDGRSQEALEWARAAGADAYARALEGRALLELNRWEEAAETYSGLLALDVGPEGQRRAFHNLALAMLREAARHDPGLALLHARGAVAAGREALRLDPRSDATRWNLALAQRLLAGIDPQEGGGDRGSIPIGEGEAGAPESGSAGPMSADEARRILDALRSGEVESLRAALRHALEAGEGGSINRGPPW